MKFHLFAAAMAMLAGTGAMAQVDEARPHALLYADIAGIPSIFSRNYDFGPASIGAVSSIATSNIGADASGSPFIKISANTTKTYDAIPSVDASLTYSWKINTEDPGDRSLVLVHFSTAGWIDSDYGYTPNKIDTYNLGRNYTALGVRALFQTAQTVNDWQVYDQRVYGLQFGVLNWGVERVSEQFADFTGQSGGDSHAHGEFSQSFDILAVANVQNTITLNAYAGYYVMDYNNYVRKYSQEYFSLSAFIDPTITIDAAYAGKYKIETSAIPVVGVPEPESWALCVAAGAAMGIRRRMNKPLA